MWRQRNAVGLVVALVLAVSGGRVAFAHCDGLDGPVVKAAQRALATGNVNFALIWVDPQDEAEVRAAFRDTMAVRPVIEPAGRLADRSFFETVVRLHRTAEGAAYTGLKPAGRDLGPAIPASDRALETGNLRELEQLVSSAVQAGLRQRYEQLIAKRQYDPDDLAAGRAYVASYVEFIHYAERLYEAASTDAHGHYAEGDR